MAPRIGDCRPASSGDVLRLLTSPQFCVPLVWPGPLTSVTRDGLLYHLLTKMPLTPSAGPPMPHRGDSCRSSGQAVKSALRRAGDGLGKSDAAASGLIVRKNSRAAESGRGRMLVVQTVGSAQRIVHGAQWAEGEDRDRRSVPRPATTASSCSRPTRLNRRERWPYNTSASWWWSSSCGQPSMMWTRGGSSTTGTLSSEVMSSVPSWPWCLPMS